MERSARLLGASNALRQQNGYARTPWESARYETDVAACREALGTGAFQAACAPGATLSPPEAVAWGVRRRRRPVRTSTGWSSLTETEQRVAMLAADGLTNPEIAERLFVAHTTVKTHMKHIFSKLGVAKRRELEGHLPADGSQ